MYMKELVYPEVLEQIRQGIDRFVIDGVLDSGIIEQLTEEDWVSPFSAVSDDRAAGSGGDGSAGRKSGVTV